MPTATPLSDLYGQAVDLLQQVHDGFQDVLRRPELPAPLLAALQETMLMLRQTISACRKAVPPLASFETFLSVIETMQTAAKPSEPPVDSTPPPLVH